MYDFAPLSLHIFSNTKLIRQIIVNLTLETEQIRFTFDGSRSSIVTFSRIHFNKVKKFIISEIHLGFFRKSEIL